MRKTLQLSLAASLALGAAGPIAVNAQENTPEGPVNVYTYRQPELIQPVLDAFTEETGIETQVLFLSQGLEERIQAEGINSPADLIMTVDISRLTAAKEAGITQPVESDVLNEDIPAEYRDPEGHWYGLTRRARVVYASKERVDVDSLTYADLASDEYDGRVCMRSGQHVYNLGLFGALIANWGEERTEEWMTGLRDNLTRAPSGNDRAQAQAIFSGECDIGLGNSYYVGLMMTNEEETEQQDWADSMKVIFPTIEEGGGTHVNISGVAMAKNAPHREAALQLMEFLSTDEAQRVYAEQNFEYPVNKGVPVSEIVQGFGELNADDTPLADIAAERSAASQMVDRVALDQGPQS